MCNKTMGKKKHLKHNFCTKVQKNCICKNRANLFCSKHIAPLINVHRKYIPKYSPCVLQIAKCIFVCLFCIESMTYSVLDITIFIYIIDKGCSPLLTLK